MTTVTSTHSKYTSCAGSDHGLSSAERLSVSAPNNADADTLDIQLLGAQIDLDRWEVGILGDQRDLMALAFKNA